MFIAILKIKLEGYNYSSHAESRAEIIRLKANSSQEAIQEITDKVAGKRDVNDDGFYSGIYLKCDVIGINLFEVDNEVKVSLSDIRDKQKNHRDENSELETYLRLCEKFALLEEEEKEKIEYLRLRDKYGEHSE